jgi:aryl-alcohol dehydrogenase-like predicted oxidoreductase
MQSCFRFKHLDEDQQLPTEDIPKLGHSPENFKMALESSLRKLQVEYIDLYQLHWADRYVPTV